MRENGLIVKSLTEHEYNNQFLGRNWNAGEVVELVLRDSRGTTFIMMKRTMAARNVCTISFIT
jgi:hypothetical protein